MRRSNLRSNALSMSCILLVAPRTMTRWLDLRALNCSSSSASSLLRAWSLLSLPRLAARASTWILYWIVNKTPTSMYVDSCSWRYACAVSGSSFYAKGEPVWDEHTMKANLRIVIVVCWARVFQMGVQGVWPSVCMMYAKCPEVQAQQTSSCMSDVPWSRIRPTSSRKITAACCCWAMCLAKANILLTKHKTQCYEPLKGPWQVLKSAEWDVQYDTVLNSAGIPVHQKLENFWVVLWFVGTGSHKDVFEWRFPRRTPRLCF